MIEQLERAKQVAVEQVQQRQQASLEEQQKAQAELAKKAAELEAAKERAKAKIANTKYKQGETAPSVSETPTENTPQPVEKKSEEIAEPPKEKKIVKKVPKHKEKPKKIKKQKPPKPQKTAKTKKVIVRKKVKKGPSNFKYYLLVIFFIALFAFVYFLPDISKYMKERAELKNAQEEIITTGDLECSKEDSDDDYDYEYTYTFAFDNSKLIKLNYKKTISTSSKDDEEELEKMNKQCELLQDQVKKLKGITIKCVLDEYSVSEEHDLRYAVLDKKKVTNGYIEAGGTYPKYKYKQNIDKIEKNMNAAGYDCERKK